MKKILYLLVAVLASASASGQSKCVCCSAPYNQFDFWVGNWNVYDTAGNKVGENEVLKLESGCLITEHWQGTRGGTGRSSNYFDPSDSTWNQLWISSTGNILKLKGHGGSDRMTLAGPLKDGVSDRITWSRNPDGSVTQLWDRIDGHGKVISVLFNGRYLRK